MASLLIKKRFCGPDTSGNGGYTAGLLAKQLRYPVRVRLHQPPPLDLPLEFVEKDQENAALMNGKELVASAQKYSFSLEIPFSPTLAEAKLASKQYEGHEFSPFPYCFVCGTKRASDDGLHIYAGKWKNGIVAAPWTPQKEWGDNSGLINEEFVWAALDCPGAYSIPNKDHRVHVLGQMAANIVQPLPILQDYIIIGWTIGVDGRKVSTGTALYNIDQQLCAVAEQMWIEVKTVDS